MYFVNLTAPGGSYLPCLSAQNAHAVPRVLLQHLPQGLQGKSYTAKIFGRQCCRRMGTRAGEEVQLGREEWTPLFGGLLYPLQLPWWKQSKQGKVSCCAFQKCLKLFCKLFQIKRANLLVALSQNLQNHQVSLFLLSKERTTSHASPTASQNSLRTPASKYRFC